jgi:hypothetical protein
VGQPGVVPAHLPSRPAANINYAAQAPVRIRFRERSHVLVKGPATGRMYEFSGSNPVQPVDAADARALLATRFFVID